MSPGFRPLAERFEEKYVAAENGCWQWTAGKMSHGYGMIAVGRTMKYAHRVAYELLVGPIPDGLTIDHLCRNRACVNPEHLEAVTIQENVRRGCTKTHCLRGHVYDEVNTYTSKVGHRQCRVCARESDLRRRPRRRVKR